MNPNLAKEIRLLLPAWSAAVLLAIIPVWLIPSDSSPTPSSLSLYPFLLGAILLGLSPFGREFSLRTFPLLLAQPAERLRTWRAKTSTLAIAIVLAFLAWLSSNLARGQFGASEFRENLTVAATGSFVALAGGLWTTLLLRQVAAAFWFTLLVPIAILTVIFVLGVADWIVPLALGIYSAAAFLYGRRLFLRIQEAAWTGGVVDIPRLKATARQGLSASRSFRPVAALCSKEFQLYQVSLAGMGCLFLLHLGVVFVRTFTRDTLGPWPTAALEVFGGLWLIVPVLVAGGSIAEERKLGTMESLLCLPVGRRKQFFIKLSFALAVAGLLSALFFDIAEGIGKIIGSKSSYDSSAVSLSLIGFLSLSFIGFCASTVTRNIMQALALAVALTLGLWALASIAYTPSWREGVPPWGGDLVFYVGWPVLVATALWLAWRNFMKVSAGWQLWRRNILGLLASLCFISLTTAYIYNRTWELFSPIEPPHGPARLTIASSQHFFTTAHGPEVALQLPDGRVWLNKSSYHQGRLAFSFGEESGIRFGGHWLKTTSTNSFPGTNWAQVVPGFRDNVGIRSDGTLWISETPAQPGDSLSHQRKLELPGSMKQFGEDSSWKSVVQQPGWSWMVVLLKQDGSLWTLGTNYFSQKNVWSGLRAFTPTEAYVGVGWDYILPGTYNYIYAWRKDGTAWGLRIREPQDSVTAGRAQPGLLAADRIPAFDHHRWKSLARTYLTEAAVLEDGTLWSWESNPGEDHRLGRPFSPKPAQVGRDNDWVSIATDWDGFAALKKDGSLWKWVRNRHLPRIEVARAFDSPPVLVSRHKDWVAIASGQGGIASVSADGGYWFWWDMQHAYYHFAQPMLIDSRRPVLLGNVFSE
jgi:ABC-type transport system involved in multi-copper enzyme maturation permease subunit/alpha-tubulin suppressor-like RCC1 family protein